MLFLSLYLRVPLKYVPLQLWLIDCHLLFWGFVCVMQFYWGVFAAICHVLRAIPEICDYVCRYMYRMYINYPYWFCKCNILKYLSFFHVLKTSIISIILLHVWHFRTFSFLNKYKILHRKVADNIGTWRGQWEGRCTSINHKWATDLEPESSRSVIVTFRLLLLLLSQQPFVGPWPFFSFLILYTVGRTPWMGDQPAKDLYLHAGQHEHRIKSIDCHTPSGNRIHDLSVRAGEHSSCIKPRGHHDRHIYIYIYIYI
jgi:hypothetical protein